MAGVVVSAQEEKCPQCGERMMFSGHKTVEFAGGKVHVEADCYCEVCQWRGREVWEGQFIGFRVRGGSLIVEGQKGSVLDG